MNFNWRKNPLLCSVIAALVVTFLPPDIGYAQDTKTDISPVVLEKCLQQGVDAGLALYEEYARQPEIYDVGENTLNTIGIKLYRNQHRFPEAVAVIEYAIQHYPESHNLVDTLAECYLVKAGYLNDLSILDISEKYYLRALEIFPDFRYSKIGLRRINIIRKYEKKEFMVPMRDGIKLFTQVYIPRDTNTTYPFILSRSPYNVSPKGTGFFKYRDSLGPCADFSTDGFIFVRQDVRGKFLSEGTFEQVRPVVSDAGDQTVTDECTDAYDTIEWLVNNIPNNNGKVGIFGCSYGGYYAVAAAINAHPALVAVVPQAPVADWFKGDDWHHNGAFFMFQAINWLRSNDRERTEPSSTWPGRDFYYPYSNAYDFLLRMGSIANLLSHFPEKHPFMEKMFAHPDYDEFWQARNILPHLRNIKPAVLTSGGWFDAEDLYGTIASYKEIESSSPDTDNRLVMGPWYHCFMNNVAEDLDTTEGMTLNMTKASKYYNEEVILPFFKYHLKGLKSHNLPEALMFDTGRLEWSHFDKWPASGCTTDSIYLASDGKLSFDKPSQKNSYSEYVSDPAKPVPYRERISAVWRYHFMHSDQRNFGTRPDVLVFETDFLEEDITIAGPVIANLFVSTTGTDADWVVKVIDMFPYEMNVLDPNPTRIVLDGYQMMVRGDVMRGKYRNSLEHPEPFEPGKVTQVKFELPDIYHTFKKGHKVIIHIQSSWFPLVDRNPQTFCNIYHAKEEDFIRSTHRIYHSDKYPSCITISQLRSN